MRHRPLRSGCRPGSAGAHCAPLRREQTGARHEAPRNRLPRRAVGRSRNKSSLPTQRQRKGCGPSPKWTAPVGLGAPPEGTRRKVLETLVSKRRFAYFADAGKVGRPQAKQPQPPSPVKFLIPNSSFLILTAPVPPAGGKTRRQRAGLDQPLRKGKKSKPAGR